MQDKTLDVVVYGATGYTGKLVVEYLLNQYGKGEDFKWAIAGRNQDKLNNLIEEFELGSEVPAITADGNDIQSLETMVQQAKCILTTAGPYQLYGSNLVKACAENGTDYVDLCGEPAWMHRMIEEHSDKANQTGARIVFSCGFDSIPFDLGVYFLQEKVKSKVGDTATAIRGRVRAMNGEFSGGTALSMTSTMASLKEKPELIEILANPFSLTNGFQGPEQPNDSKPQFDEKLETWVAPFFMAPINSKNIHRSNALLNHSYGKEFTYNEMWIQGPGDEGQAAAELISKINPLENAPKPGEGPSKEARENGNYDILFCADLDNGSSMHASVTGDLDPGYGSTSKMIAESAICLIQDCTYLAGGIYTPAASMGSKLISRLEASAGLRFSEEN